MAETDVNEDLLDYEEEEAAEVYTNISFITSEVNFKKSYYWFGLVLV